MVACKVDHSTLIDVKFCEVCGEKVDHSYWTCQNNHRVEMQYEFCLTCGADKKVQKAVSRNSIQPKISKNAINSINELDSQVNNPYAPTHNSSSSNKQLAIISIVVVALIALGVVATVLKNVTTVKTTTVEVTQTISGENCYDLSWGYGDIPGAQVILRADGSTVGYGTYSALGTESLLGCKFTAFVYDVPMNAENYSVELASGRRGVVYNTKADMISNDWNIYLTLGS
jgi:hypothetical protein